MPSTRQQQRIRSELASRGYAALSSGELALEPELLAALEELLQGWDALPEDRFMGDGGRYRTRRYSRFRLDRETGELSSLSGTSIYQSREDNPLNGGLVRTFEPLDEGTRANPFLRGLVWFDFTSLPIGPDRPRYWAVGVHQVRITAAPGVGGKPTPEGIHIDGEEYTVQHLFRRENISGGTFTAYDADRRPVFEWLQTERLDSVFFTGTTLHDATPVESADGSTPGRRDILLIDFDPIPSEG